MMSHLSFRRQEAQAHQLWASAAHSCISINTSFCAVFISVRSSPSAEAFGKVASVSDIVHWYRTRHFPNCFQKHSSLESQDVFWMLVSHFASPRRRRVRRRVRRRRVRRRRYLRRRNRRLVLRRRRVRRRRDRRRLRRPQVSPIASLSTRDSSSSSSGRLSSTAPSSALRRPELLAEGCRSPRPPPLWSSLRINERSLEGFLPMLGFFAGASSWTE
mmetsp:Transcript_47956/g.102677  ORF Transcript_47956/g.102677 Transcript_47956/m.102677 type:complete len:216 (+) Transcript_47956:1570-2217(+)